MKFFFLSLLVIICFVSNTRSQTLYSIDGSKVSATIQPGHFNMGNAGPAGKELKINSRYITLDGKPMIPVMGEMHFSRLAKEKWEDVILKMKASGINIISCYLFWNHHEEIEGQFDWNGNRDFRSFIQLCAKHSMWVYPRLGPWSHGEARNGGTPDWILTKKMLKNRTNDVVYQQYVTRYFRQIGGQVKGLLYKDGGPVIGIQLENEYTKGKAGEPHILWLKQTAIACGFDVPMYTVTGWGDGSVPEGEVIPLWGGYPDQPWDPTVAPMTSCSDFEFTPFRNDEKIGNGLAQKKEVYMDYSNEPFFTCEMGVGVHTTRHRRSVISRIDGLSMVANKVGSGSNLLGYYLYAGGSNPVGLLTGMQEDKDETGNWSETPAISYDFQAAIKENGELSPSYYEVKKLNYFLNEFGDMLAPMEPAFGSSKDGIQYSVRARDDKAFLFGINYCRFAEKPERKLVQFKINLKNEEIIFPSVPVNIEDSSVFIWPLNLALADNIVIKYATAQPICKLQNDKGTVWVFFQNLKQAAEFCFDANSIVSVESSSGKVDRLNNRYILAGLIAGKNNLVTVTGKDGSIQKIVLLTAEEAGQAWLFKDGSSKKFFLSAQNMYRSGNELHVYGKEATQQFSMFGAGKMIDGAMKKNAGNGLFTTYENTISANTVQPKFVQKKLLDDAQWLKTSVAYIDKNNLLYHKLFQKEFNLGNPSAIRSAIIYIASETGGRLQINNSWVNQKVTPGKINTLDITGYVKKGDNILLADFPFIKGDNAFAARVIIQYFNTDEIEFYTDSSWLMAEQYYYPAPLGTFANFFSRPQIVGIPPIFEKAATTDFTEYTIDLPCDYLSGLNNLYLSTKYLGDRAECRLHNKLIADNFNNNTRWDIDLNRNGSQLQCRSLQLKIFPFQADDKILFDIPVAAADWQKAVIEKMEFIPEYKKIFLQ